MNSRKFATTFGGSEFGPDSSEYQEGIKLGRFLSEKGYTIKCGGYYGLMEAVAKGAQEVGGVCIGITNSSYDPKIANAFVSKNAKLAIYSRGYGGWFKILSFSLYKTAVLGPW